MRKWILLFMSLYFFMPVSAKEPEVSAKSAIVLEYSTGKVLYAKNAEERLPMASTTKIMTALIALENGNIDEMVTIGPSAVGIEGSSMYLKQGEKMTLKELIYGLMLSSGNDAAVAIAEHIAGSEAAFTEKMNLRAKELGCSNTQFKNANGLPDEAHYTTALELALITGKALENNIFREIVSSAHAMAGGRHLSNHNKMLSLYEGAIGVKTGFTKAAGRTLVSAAERNGIMLIAVTLNAPDDWDDHTAMLDYGFAGMEKRKITEKGTVAGKIKIYGGTEENAEVVFDSDFFLPVMKSEKTEVKCPKVEAINAPISKGVEVGKAEIYLEGVKMGEVRLLTNENVPLLPKPTVWEFLCKIFEIWAAFYIL